jgi:hypothetical protein
MKTCHLSRCGAATSPVRWLTGATCRGRPRRRLPARPKCRHHGGHRQPRATSMWGRARDKQLALPERTSGRSALVWRPAGRAPPGRRVPRLAKSTPREGQRSGWLPPATFMMAPTALTRTPCRGVDRGGSRRTRRRRRACRRWRSLAPPCDTCNGPTPVVARVEGSASERAEERVAAVEAADRSGAAPRVGGPEARNPRAGGEACSPRAGLAGPPGEEASGALQDVSSRLRIFYRRSSNLLCSSMLF